MRRGGLAGAMFCLLASACLARESGPEQRGQGIHLDVVVTDAAGKPISGLHGADFKLLDDGRERSVDSFAAFDGLNAKADPPVQMILIIDCVNNGAVELAYIRQGLTKFLRQKIGRLTQPTTVVRFTLSGVDFLAKPSTDGNALAAMVDQIGAANKPVGLDVFALSLNALSSVVNKVANLLGRKTLIWVGPGWYTPVTSPHVVTAIDARGRRADYRLMVQFAKAMEEGRIALYGGYEGADFYVRDYSKPVRKVIFSTLQAERAVEGLSGRLVMYGPPRCRKRKKRVTVWSAQMYSAFVGAEAARNPEVWNLYSSNVLARGQGQRRIER